MIRALVADDEELARRSLIAILAAEPDVQIVGEASNGIEALERVAELRPDVIFLDIEMPGLNGLEVVDNLQSPPPIVFVTAYDEYAVRAFETNAIDYVLKPVQAERVLRSLERIRVFLEKGRDMQSESLKTLMAELRGGAVRKIAGHKGKRIVLLSPKEIAHASIEDKLVFLYAGEDRYMSDKSVGELESMLESSGFFRINRGDIVNLEHARELVPWFSGTYKLRLTNGAELDVSRDRPQAERVDGLLKVPGTYA